MKAPAVRFDWALVFSFTVLGLLIGIVALVAPRAGLLLATGIAVAAALAVAVPEKTLLALSLAVLALLAAGVGIAFGGSLAVGLFLAATSCLAIGGAAALVRELVRQFQMQQMQLGVWQHLRAQVKQREASASAPLEAGRAVLAQELYRAQRYGRPVSIVLLSIEGAQSGPVPQCTLPELLTLAAVLQQVLRQTDHIVHLRADQFLIILPETNAEGAVTVMRRVVELAREYGLALRGGVVTHPYQGSDPDDLLKQAEAALHRAQVANKTAGTFQT